MNAPTRRAPPPSRNATPTITVTASPAMKGPAMARIPATISRPPRTMSQPAFFFAVSSHVCSLDSMISSLRLRCRSISGVRTRAAVGEGSTNRMGGTLAMHPPKRGRNEGPSEGTIKA